MSKYVQLKSLTWWSSFVPLIGGIIVALSAGIPQIEWVAAIVNSMTGNLSAAVLINAGLLGIGIVGRTGK